MTIEYKEGPKDQPWEVAEEDYSYLYVQRVGRDLDPQRIRTEPSFALDRDGEPGREIAEHLRDLLNERDALTAWSCVGCGARFASRVPPELLNGVTHCSSCVMADKMTKELLRTRQALEALMMDCINGGYYPSPSWRNAWDLLGGYATYPELRGQRGLRLPVFED